MLQTWAKVKMEHDKEIHGGKIKEHPSQHLDFCWYNRENYVIRCEGKYNPSKFSKT